MQLKKIARIVGLSIALSALLPGLTACGWGDSAGDHVARAQQFIASSDSKSAIIELKNALQLDNQSAEARYLLGKTYLDSGDMPSAEKELERAGQLGWPVEEVQPALARALLAQGEYARVRELSARGLTAGAQTSLLASQSLAAMALGDTWDAEELIDKALANNPDSAEVLLVRTRLLASQEDIEGAEAMLEQVLSRHPEQGQAWSLKGDLLMRQEDWDGALAAFDKAIALQQNNYNDLFKRAMLNLQLGNYAAAQADTETLLARMPQAAGPNYLQGLLHYQAGRYGEAVTALSLAEPAFERYPLALFFLASAQLLQGNMDQAATMAGRFHNTQPDSIRGRKLLATIRLQQGKYPTVSTLLKPVLAANPDDVDALNLAANALLRQGKTDEGIALLSKVAQLQPDSPVAQVRLGAGLLIGGQGDDAARHMETALALNPEFQQADILLVLNYLQKRDYPAAIEAAEAYQRRHLTSVTPYNLLGKVYLEAGRPDKARAAFERALALDGGDPAANHNLAQMALADNDLKAARDFYETILVAHEDSVSTLIQLALLDAREGDETSLVTHLEQAMAADTTALQPRLLLARYYLGKGKPEQVAPLFTTLEKQQQQAPEVLRLLAMAQLSSRDASAAQFTLQQLLESTPDSAPIRHMMAMAAAGAGDKERAAEELQRALALDENYLPSRIVLAKMALATGSMAEFEQHLEKLKAQAPDNPEILLLRAAAERGQGNTATALGLAEKAYGLAPTTGTLIALATYQETVGDRPGAHQRYKQWLEEHPEDTAARMAYANSLQLAQRLDDAGQQYATVLQATPDNVIALNNQAWILRQKNSEQALEYARKAATLAPDSGEVLDTLAVVEYINKDYPRARRSIERALKANPDQPSMLYHSAMIAAALDDKAAARATLERLLGANTAFPEIAEAKALLAQLGQ